MNKELIETRFKKFEKDSFHFNGQEYWSARDLMNVFNYSDWSLFSKLINKAQQTCTKAREEVADHFVGYHKVINRDNGAKRKVEDVALTMYACYLIAKNVNSTEQVISFAQTYFAVQTKKQKLQQQRLLGIVKVETKEKPPEEKNNFLTMSMKGR